MGERPRRACPTSAHSVLTSRAVGPGVVSRSLHGASETGRAIRLRSTLAPARSAVHSLVGGTVAEEMLFTIAGSTATPAAQTSLSAAGLREREHLQEWVKAHPRMLGEDLLFLTDEFDRWITRGGQPTHERLDVLALDRAG